MLLLDRAPADKRTSVQKNIVDAPRYTKAGPPFGLPRTCLSIGRSCSSHFLYCAASYSVRGYRSEYIVSVNFDGIDPEVLVGGRPQAPPRANDELRLMKRALDRAPVDKAI